MKILCIISLLHVVTSNIDGPDTRTSVWTLVELYSEYEDYLASDKFENCLKIQLSKTTRKCKCPKKDLFIYEVKTDQEKMAVQYLTFVQNYREMKQMDNGQCECDVFFARMLNYNYFIVYKPIRTIWDVTSRPPIALLAMNVPMIGSDIEKLEAIHEELYNRKHFPLCSDINRKFYFN